MYSEIIGYVVVENAGYEDERDVQERKDYWEALDWAVANYDPDEMEKLHIAIASVDAEGNRSYEN